jgi:putative DNA primase/helicase
MKQRFSDSTAQYQLAELKGARFVGVAETKRGVELEEATVKQITGSDTISARAPYGKPFSYRPQFKIWLSTNHKPEIPDGSEAIWDRMRLIPFTQRFEGKKADADLPEKLREELAGVLAWAVRGCVEWVRQGGLGSSEAVDRATAAYRAETDLYERFLADACVFGPKMRVGKSALFRAWAEWCDSEGEETGKQNQFSRDMKEKGGMKNFEEKKIKGTWYWSGIGVLETGPESLSVENVPPSQNGVSKGKHGGREDQGGTI